MRFSVARADCAVIDAVVAPFTIHMAVGGHRILHRSHSQGERPAMNFRDSPANVHMRLLSHVRCWSALNLILASVTHLLRIFIRISIPSNNVRTGLS